MPHKKTYKFGLLAEKITILFLFLKGYQILAWRYKTYFGEIDIIAKKSKTIIAVEVKARRTKTLVEEVLRPNQIKRIHRAMEFFIAKNPRFHDHNLRFDFVEVGRFFSIKHHKNFIIEF
jgi:putative endonuclease